MRKLRIEKNLDWCGAECVLEQLFGAMKPVIDAQEVRDMLETWRDLKREWRERKPLEVCLSDYDELPGGGEVAI